MDQLFDPKVDFYAKRRALAQARRLPPMQVELKADPQPQNFVEPNPDYHAVIRSTLGEEVGTATFGISPLNDTLYLYQIDVFLRHRRQGYALAFLCWLHQEHGLPITPVHIVGSALSFWGAARHLQSLGLVVNCDLRTSEMAEEKARWAHLIPEPEHLRLQRECEAAAEWESIRQGFPQ